jgi:hypothetical protein
MTACDYQALRKLISIQQVSNFDETGIFWKIIPDLMLLSQKVVLEYKPAKDRPMLLLGVDFKHKLLLVYHSQNNEVLSGCLKQKLQMF